MGVWRVSGGFYSRCLDCAWIASGGYLWDSRIEQLRKVRTGQVNTGQFRTGPVRTGQVGIGQPGTGQVQVNQVGTVQVWTDGQFGTCNKTKPSQDKSSQVGKGFLDNFCFCPKFAWPKNVRTKILF